MTAATNKVNKAFQRVISLRKDPSRPLGAKDRGNVVASAVGETKLPSTSAMMNNKKRLEAKKSSGEKTE